MKVSLIMGSISDKDVVLKCKKFLDDFGVDSEVKVLSCHRSPNILKDYVKEAEEKGVEIFIAFAGKSAALPGILCTLTDKPVIGVPLKSDFLDGLDSLLSIAQLPKNTGVGCMGLGSSGALNAGYFALKILSLQDESLRSKLKDFKRKIEKEIEDINRSL